MTTQETMKKTHFTYKQQRQIINIFEHLHEFTFHSDVDPGAGTMALIRACRDYCDEMSKRHYASLRPDHRQRCIERLIERLDILCIRYYGKI